MGAPTGANGSCYRVPTVSHPRDFLMGTLMMFLMEAPSGLLMRSSLGAPRELKILPLKAPYGLLLRATCTSLGSSISNNLEAPLRASYRSFL